MTKPSTPAGVEKFIQTALSSRLLDLPQLAAARAVVPAELGADGLADHLVRTGKLSSYQARSLLAGRWRGLFVRNYQVLGPIGKGGVGKVYLARDQRSGALVALKVLPPHRIRRRERILARFHREMEICQRVTHPDLARTFETGEDNGVWYIAMEYFPGQSLAHLVAVEGPLAPERAARLLAQVADAIDHAHRQGIIHRDLKPGNVQVTPDDQAKVLDLGLALVRGEELEDSLILGGARRIVGTMDYISPEQSADATHVDARSDIYSLGCMFYFVLSGQKPFPGGTNRDKIRRQRTENPPPLASLRPGLPPALTDLVARMMAKDPAQRPQTAAAVAVALRNSVGKPPEKGDRRPPGVRPTAAPWWLPLMLGLCGLACGTTWYCLAH